MTLDYTDAGKRIKLISTNDQYNTKLKPGDLGTILYRFDYLDCMYIAVHWDNGLMLSLIEGVDCYQIIKC
jgi:Domain of unknown function (DUF4314)